MKNYNIRAKRLKFGLPKREQIKHLIQYIDYKKEFLRKAARIFMYTTGWRFLDTITLTSCDSATQLHFLYVIWFPYTTNLCYSLKFSGLAHFLRISDHAEYPRLASMSLRKK